MARRNAGGGASAHRAVKAQQNGGGQKHSGPHRENSNMSGGAVPSFPKPGDPNISGGQSPVTSPPLSPRQPPISPTSPKSPTSSQAKEGNSRWNKIFQQHEANPTYLAPSEERAREAMESPKMASAPHGEQGYETEGVRLRTNFVDRLREHAESRHHNPYYNKDRCAAKICMHPAWEPVCLFAIVINALWIGYSVDEEDPDDRGNQTFRTWLVENMFCFWFVVEILFRIGAYRQLCNYFAFDKKNRLWNVIDFILVFFLVVETVFLPRANKGKSEEQKQELPALSAVRIIRLLRIVRILRFVPELAMLVRSLAAALRSTFMTGAMAAGVMYVFSLIFTQWARFHKQKHLPCDPPETCVQEAFGSVTKSMLTFFQILCFDQAFMIIRAVYRESLIYGNLLIVFIVIAAFTVLNMLIGVVCQVVRFNSKNERSARMKMEVTKLLKLLEIEDTGFISRRELVRNRHVLQELENVGVTEITISAVLRILDRKKVKQESEEEALVLDLEEFMEIVFKLMHPPQTQDMLLIQSKLGKLERALGANVASQGLTQATQVTHALGKYISFLDEDDGEQLRVGAQYRQAVISSIWGLEEQIDMTLDDAFEKSEERESFWGNGQWAVEFRRLDSAMCRLRVRLERCRDVVEPFSTGRQGGADIDELASFEQRYWRKLCSEIVHGISTVSTLLAQAVQGADPNATFGGGPVSRIQPPEDRVSSWPLLQPSPPSPQGPWNETVQNWPLSPPSPQGPWNETVQNENKVAL